MRLEELDKLQEVPVVFCDDFYYRAGFVPHGG